MHVPAQATPRDAANATSIGRQRRVAPAAAAALGAYGPGLQAGQAGAGGSVACRLQGAAHQLGPTLSGSGSRMPSGSHPRSPQEGNEAIGALCMLQPVPAPQRKAALKAGGRGSVQALRAGLAGRRCRRPLPLRLPLLTARAHMASPSIISRKLPAAEQQKPARVAW